VDHTEKEVLLVAEASPAELLELIHHGASGRDVDRIIQSLGFGGDVVPYDMGLALVLSAAAGFFLGLVLCLGFDFREIVRFKNFSDSYQIMSHKTNSICF
jgi:hypothetical protein